jgi:hypothetical protein
MNKKHWRILIAVAAVFVGFAIFVVQQAVENSRKAECKRGLKGIWLGLHDYYVANGKSFPPQFIGGKDGKPKHSWRALILPYVYYNSDYKSYRFSESWDSPHNREFLNGRTLYACPTHSQSPEMTNYVAVVGDNTLWPQPKGGVVYGFHDVGEHDTPWPEVKDWASPSRDEHGDTILLVELIKSDIPWTEPRDITLDDLGDMIKRDPTGRLFNSCVNGVLAVDALGQVHVIDPSEDFEKIRAMFFVKKRAGGVP